MGIEETEVNSISRMPPSVDIGARAPLLAIRYLKVHFDLAGRRLRLVKAVDGVTIDIVPGETPGLVRESRCGKPPLCRNVVRTTEPTSGQVLYRNNDLAHLSA